MPTDILYFSNPFFNPLSLIAFGILLCCIGFLPTMIAFTRTHPYRRGIAFLNLFFGWTGIGWIMLMVWACDTHVFQDTRSSRARFSARHDRTKRA